MQSVIELVRDKLDKLNQVEKKSSKELI